MYTVLGAFCDGENGVPFPSGKGGHTYNAGDTYPMDGFEPTKEHIAYLLDGGRFGRAVIVEAEGEKEDPAKKEDPAGKKAAAKKE